MSHLFVLERMTTHIIIRGRNKSFATPPFVLCSVPLFLYTVSANQRIKWRAETFFMTMFVPERSERNGKNNECELNNLAVLPEYRHCGFGKRLLEHAYETAGNQGCKLVNIGIVEENIRLRKWYEQNGAVHTGTKKFDFFPFTCGYMVKKL